MDEPLIKVYGNTSLSSGTAERPLVTFALFAYNQERYIREAVEGAFSQTYSPLEIILSDDCSTDHTYEIMEEMAREYAGPHRVICRRNITNKGVNEHVNNVFDISSGDLLIMAAGDDISDPHRATIIVQHWMNAGKPNAAICSGAHVINESGSILYDQKKKSISKGLALARYCWNLQGILHGATAAYAKSLFLLFGKLPNSGNTEDLILTFRALLADGIIFIDKHLIRYRRSESALTSYLEFSDLMRWKQRIESEVIAIQANMKDIAVASSIPLVSRFLLVFLLKINYLLLRGTMRISPSTKLKRSFIMILIPGYSIFGRVAGLLNIVGLKEDSKAFCLLRDIKRRILNP